MNLTARGMQNAMTNIINLHTYPVSHVDLLAAGVLVVDGQPLQLSSDVVRSSRVHVPVRIYTIRAGRQIGALLWRSSKRGIRPLVAAKDGVPFLVAELADNA